MVKLSLAETDVEAEVEGRWVQHDLGYWFCIARMETPKFAEARRIARKPYAERERAGGDLTEQEQNDVNYPLFARHILKGWREVDDENGKPIPYSYENALKLFYNPALRDVAQWILLQSVNAEKYRRAALETSQGNSLAGSNGS